MTENSNSLVLNGNQLSIIPNKGNQFNSNPNLMVKNRLKGTEVFSKGQIYFAGEPYSGGNGSGGSGAISSHVNLSLQSRHNTQKNLIDT